MGIRIEWQWQNRNSGSAYRQRVALVDDGPEQSAYQRLLAHCSSCRTCLTVNEAGEATGDCEDARRLYEDYRRALRGRAMEPPPAQV